MLITDVLSIETSPCNIYDEQLMHFPDAQDLQLRAPHERVQAECWAGATLRSAEDKAELGRQLVTRNLSDEELP